VKISPLSDLTVGVGPFGAQGAEAPEAGSLEGPLGPTGAAAQGELVADDLTVVAVDDGRQVIPAVRSAGDVGQVDRPAHVARRKDAPAALDAGSRRHPALMHEPVFRLEDAVDRFEGHERMRRPGLFAALHELQRLMANWTGACSTKQTEATPLDRLGARSAMTMPDGVLLTAYSGPSRSLIPRQADH
jgi:hypothetical protein